MVSAQAPGFVPLPPLAVPAGNPVTEAKALLGKTLFWDEQWSAGRTVACGTCHIPAAGGSDPRSAPGRATGRSVHPGLDGIFGTGDDAVGSPGVVRTLGDGSYGASPFGMAPQVTPRKAPTVINAAFHPHLFWDGRADGQLRHAATGAVLLPAHAALENQAMAPPTNDVEMGFHGVTWSYWERQLQLVRPLALAEALPADVRVFVGERSYPELFATAFGDAEITAERVVMALATYQRTLVSRDSPYDRYVQGDGSALTPAQVRGMNLFFGQARCDQCHPAPLFTDHAFRNIGVRPWQEDPGRMAVTGAMGDRGRFLVPSLRNVALRAPFFHNGGAPTLVDVMQFYDRVGDFRDNLDSRMLPIGLSQQDVTDLVAFMHALTDPAVAQERPPFDRPRLYTESRRQPVTWGRGFTPGSAAVAEIVALGPPILGNLAFPVGVRGGDPGALAWLMLSPGAHPNGVAIGGALIYPTLGPGLSLVPAGVLLGTGPGSGFGSVSLRLPDPHPALRGLSVYGQWVLVDPAGPSAATSDAFGMTLF